MSSLPFGIQFSVNDSATPRLSLAKLIIFSSALLLAAMFWGGLGWLVLRAII